MEAGMYIGRELTKTEGRLCGIAFPTKTDTRKEGDGVYSFGMFGIEKTGLVELQPLVLRLNKDNGVGYSIHKGQDVVGHGSISENASDYDRINSNDTLTMDTGMMLCEGRILRIGVGYLHGWSTDDEFRPSPKIALFGEMVKENWDNCNGDSKNLAKYGGRVWTFERLADFFMQQKISRDLSIAGLDKALAPLADVYCNFPRCSTAYWFEDAYTLAMHVFAKEQREAKPMPEPARSALPDPGKQIPRKRENPTLNRVIGKEEDLELDELIFSTLGEYRPDISEGVEKSIDEDDGLIDFAYKKEGRVMVKGKDKEIAEIYIMGMS